MKILSIVGARPQFVKLAPIHHEIAKTESEHVVLHTGQHYDAGMSDSIFQDLRIPTPQINLGAGSGRHGEQTGKMLAAIEDALDEVRPDKVLVYGDTNSTLAGALAATKMHFFVAHLEAGLRSRNRLMPEEINRVATDHISDLCLAPTSNALRILDSEGLGGRSELVGDVMADVCLQTRSNVEDNPPKFSFDLPSEFVLATIHRAENTDEPGRLADILSQLSASPLPVVLPAHPRLVTTAKKLNLSLNAGNLFPVKPVSYSELVALVLRATSVVTDSGGLQKEAYLLNTVCTTVRPETEWPETMTSGMNLLVEPGDILNAMQRSVGASSDPDLFGGGHAASAVVHLLLES